MRLLLALLLLAGCSVQQPVMPSAAPPNPPACPDAPAVVVAPAKPIPPPVWPNACVTDWYAKATLPACVEDYLKTVKKQQKVIAKRRKHHRKPGR